jgi:acyl-coenzyme A synthetase/AMP-(fatty) acid ligase
VADLNGITAIQAFKSVYDHQVDFVVLPPSALFYIKKLKLLAMPMPWVKQTLFTGEALSWNVVQDWKTSAFYSEIDNAYGPTEGTVWSLIDTLDDSIEQQLVNGLCPIGQSLKTIQIQIVNDKGDQVAKGERGELWIGGPQIFHGYVNLQEKTNEVLFEEKGIRWYKTGDIVFENDFNKIMYVNRKDNQVQINGYRVELGEVEHHLRNCLSSDAAVVLAHSNENVTELFAFIESEGKSEEQILDALRKNLPAYMVPRSVFILPSLPVNASGKIDKTNLRNTYLEI